LQYAITLFLIGNAMGQFFSGPLSDGLGQKKVLFLGLSLFTLSSVGCALSNHIAFLLCSRFFQGMGSAVGPVLARAIATTDFPSKRSTQVQSYGAMGVGIASMIAILSSGKLTVFSWRSNFYLAAAFGLVLVFWSLRACRNETKRNLSPSFSYLISQMKQVLSDRSFLVASLCHAMTYGLMYAYIAMFPFLLKNQCDVTQPEWIGLYSALMIAIYMAGAFITSRLVIKYQLRTILFSGVSLQLLSGVMLLFLPMSYFFMLSLYFFNFSIGMILPVTTSLALKPFVKGAVGTASSSLGLTYRLIGSFISIAICKLPLNALTLGAALVVISIFSLGITTLQRKTVTV
jgi:MFS transporter, DHA1 family, multidrug resistance protein